MRCSSIIHAGLVITMLAAQVSCGGDEAEIGSAEQAAKVIVRPAILPKLSSSLAASLASLLSDMMCPQWRWVGVKAQSTAACPKPMRMQTIVWKGKTSTVPVPNTHWVTSQLFGAGAPQSLSRFCVYEYDTELSLADGLQVPKVDYDSIKGMVGSGLLAVERDCMTVPQTEDAATSVSAAVKTMQDYLRSRFQGLFDQQAGRLSNNLNAFGDVVLPAPKTSSSSYPELTIVDMAVPCETCSDGAKFSTHAATMKSLADRLLGSGVSKLIIPLKLTPPLVLGFTGTVKAQKLILTTKLPVLGLGPLAVPPPPPPSPPGSASTMAGNLSGIFSVAQVAAAIEQRLEAAVGKRLVFNLSIAWDDKLRGDWFMLDSASYREQEPPAVLALREVLRVASCRGAIVLSAAGNKVDPAQAAGALAPATWETQAAPTASECKLLLGATPQPWAMPRLPTAYRPLVYAVSAVDAVRHPVANAPAGSSPRLAVHGDHSATTRAPLTGSSAATIVAAATATAVWRYRPDLRPDEVMNEVYLSGEPVITSVTTVGKLVLPIFKKADFCKAGVSPCPLVRSVSFCGALKRVCPSTVAGSNCPVAAFSCTTPTASVPVLDDVPALTGAPASTAPAAAWTTATTSKPGLYSLMVLQPQPEPGTCPNCGIRFRLPYGDLYTDPPEPTYDPASLKDPTLVVTYRGGMVYTRALGTGYVPPGRTRVSNLPPIAATEITSAALRYTIDNTAVVDAPLAIFR